jgi:general secretion pathway protein C
VVNWKSVKLRLTHISPVGVAKALLIGALIVQGARLCWAIVEPLGPVGAWQPVAALSGPVDPAFDPFFRASANSGATTVTGLPLKLFGVRIDVATGRNSAIIATPDGVQSSIGLGEEVMPGVTLKTVLADHIVLDRGGAEEQLFLDQSVPAPLSSQVPAAASPIAPAPPIPAPPPATNAATPLAAPPIS